MLTRGELISAGFAGLAGILDSSSEEENTGMVLICASPPAEQGRHREHSKWPQLLITTPVSIFSVTLENW